MTKKQPKRDKSGKLLPGQGSLNPKGRPKEAGERLLWQYWEDYGSVKFKQALVKGRSWAVKELMKKLFPDRKAEEITAGDKGFQVILQPRLPVKQPSKDQPKQVDKPK